MDYESLLTADIHHRITSPTCEDLGIPRDPGVGTYDFHYESPRDGKGRHLVNTAENERGHSTLVDLDPQNPFSVYSQIPLPNLYTQYDYSFEPAFIRKRNERERERVRCVNEGYARLRDHIPLENKEKRISKVETLRCAIRYIKHLQELLSQIESSEDKSDNDQENIDCNDAKSSPLKSEPPLKRRKCSN